MTKTIMTSETLDRIETAIANDIFHEIMDAEKGYSDQESYEKLEAMHKECVDHYNAHVTGKLSDDDYEEWLKDIFARSKWEEINFEETADLFYELKLEWDW